MYLFKKAVAVVVLNSTSLYLMLLLPSSTSLTKFDKELARNILLSIDYNLQDVVFVISFPFLSTLVLLFVMQLKKICIF